MWLSHKTHKYLVWTKCRYSLILKANSVMSLIGRQFIGYTSSFARKHITFVSYDKNIWAYFKSSFPHQTRKKKSANSFPGTAPTFAWPQSFVFLSLTTFKTASVFNSNWKWRDTSPTHFLYVSNHSQPPPDLWNGATAHDQTCPSVHWFRWNTFWASVVNCDLIHNANSTLIQFGTCLL